MRVTELFVICRMCSRLYNPLLVSCGSYGLCMVTMDSCKEKLTMQCFNALMGRPDTVVEIKASFLPCISVSGVPTGRRGYGVSYAHFLPQCSSDPTFPQAMHALFVVNCPLWYSSGGITALVLLVCFGAQDYFYIS